MDEKKLPVLFAQEQPVLTTERLIPRPLEEGDVFSLVGYFNDPEVSLKMLIHPYPFTDLHALEYIQNAARMWKDGKGGLFAIVLKEKSKKIGIAGLRNLDFMHETGAISFLIDPLFQQRSYAAEAAKAVLNFGFKDLHLNCIRAFVLSHNEASRCLVKKIGMQFDACFKERCKKRGQYHDIENHSMLRGEFQ